MGLLLGIGTTSKAAGMKYQIQRDLTVPSAFGVMAVFGVDLLLLFIFRPYRDKVKLFVELASATARTLVLVALILRSLFFKTLWIWCSFFVPHSMTGVWDRSFSGFVMFSCNISATFLNFVNSLVNYYFSCSGFFC